MNCLSLTAWQLTFSPPYLAEVAHWVHVLQLFSSLDIYAPYDEKNKCNLKPCLIQISNELLEADSLAAFFSSDTLSDTLSDIHPMIKCMAKPSLVCLQALMTEELLPRAMHLCYSQPWSTRLAGVDTLALLTAKCVILTSNYYSNYLSCALTRAVSSSI